MQMPVIANYILVIIAVCTTPGGDHITAFPCGRGFRILPPYSLRVVKGELKGRSEGARNPLLCIFFLRTTRM